ncbi:MAG: hypothetical protein AABX89_06080 [Candidatus Thermoplasmatota archaeon]
MVAMLPSRALIVCLALLVPLLSGCAQDAVSNQTDHFSYSGQVAGLSDTKTYTWQTTGTKAAVSWGGQSSQGTFTLTIQDANGKQLYSKSIGGTSQGGVHENTATGVAGEWKVTLAFKGFTGQMGLSLNVNGSPGGTYCPPAVPGC